ncbi:DUF507 family protein [bacterium]|nr:DUF507 family protein [bacterium]
MRLTEERVTVIAREIANVLLDDELVDLELDEDRFEFLIANLIIKDLAIEGEIEEEATAWLKKNRARVEEGSTEWDIEMERIKEELAVARGYVIR